MIKFSKREIEEFIKLLDFSKIKGGLVPVITQDNKTNKVLILAFANKEAIRETLETGYVHFFSRTRKILWKKGETSGNVEEVEHVIIDCDNDSLLFKVSQTGGAACHRGYDTCFYNEFKNGKLNIIGQKILDTN
ncbi:MAG: phosphoribosyl-AMP cyclohydrolase [Promethearchaeota archaeon]